MRSLGADHIGLEAMVKTVAFPLSEIGAFRLLGRGVTGSDLASKRILLAEWGGHKREQRTGYCKSLDGR